MIRRISALRTVADAVTMIPLDLQIEDRLDVFARGNAEHPRRGPVFRGQPLARTQLPGRDPSGSIGGPERLLMSDDDRDRLAGNMQVPRLALPMPEVRRHQPPEAALDSWAGGDGEQSEFLRG